MGPLRSRLAAALAQLFEEITAANWPLQRQGLEAGGGGAGRWPLAVQAGCRAGAIGSSVSIMRLSLIWE